MRPSLFLLDPDHELCLSFSTDLLSEPWIRTFQLPSSSRPSSHFCSSSTTGLCMTWSLAPSLSSDPGPGDAHEPRKEADSIAEQALCDFVLFIFLPFFKMPAEFGHRPVKVSSRHTGAFRETRAVLLHVRLPAASRVCSCDGRGLLLKRRNRETMAYAPFFC